MLTVRYGCSYVLLDYFWNRLLPVNTYHVLRKPLSIALFVILLATLFIKRARKYGLIISHIYAIIVGLLSYAMFTAYLQNLGAEVFYKNILLAIGAFIAFGRVLINDDQVWENIYLLL